MHSWPPITMAESIVRGAVMTVVSASVAMMLIPLAEWMTGITTDITLLELADPSRPLLRRLATEAPGTYAHSVAMASLCEQACNAIGANGLLARIGCYYHDVGKLVQPKYFVENQVTRINPHDQLPPADSARVVRSHVVEGLRLGREAGLPPVVLAFIPEHHGTMYLDYFRDRARQDGTYANTDDDAYRYPGPRPRSVETAVTMLADSAEAALRVLGEPTPERIRSAIEYLIQQKVEAGQLKEAPLTLSDLDRVKEEFVQHMTGIYHARVEYPGTSGGIAALFPTRGAGRG
ncbi:MAG: HDIG domain-containing metalloprotein, partial [Gemmatimonadales bacterium]